MSYPTKPAIFIFFDQATQFKTS